MALINIAPPPPPIPVLNCPESVQYGSVVLKLNLPASHGAGYCLYDSKANEIVKFVGVPFDENGSLRGRSINTEEIR